MFNLTDFELQEYIKGDLPYDDLTTSLQNCNNKKVKLEVFTREDILISCTEEAARIAQLLGCEILSFIKSKHKAFKGDTILSFVGEYENIHKAWRVCQILLEYSCKISTYAYEMKEKIDKVNPNCELLTTRKTFPFSKRFCIKAATCGGAMPHRLGLSETILFFDGHRIIYKNNEEFYEAIKNIKNKTSEKSIAVESDSYEDSIKLMEIGVDTIQLDKVDSKTIQEIVSYKNVNFPECKILVAGGINIKNVEEFAKLNIDGVVTSSVYVSGMANISSKLSLLY